MYFYANPLKYKTWHKVCYKKGMRMKLCFCGGCYVYVTWWKHKA